MARKSTVIKRPFLEHGERAPFVEPCGFKTWQVRENIVRRPELRISNYKFQYVHNGHSFIVCDEVFAQELATYRPMMMMNYFHLLQYFNIWFHAIIILLIIYYLHLCTIVIISRSIRCVLKCARSQKYFLYLQGSHKIEEWKIKDILWYVGHEIKRNPQSRWAITFIPRNKQKR